ncbi:MAG: dTDP-4-dehydrorhamnose 3,5-epimerase [Candidatus Pacebacteria bacterium]|nr:dTDP-4-dehydrorhamnose 3,5-epimerase [Candidatus Paceibacterota bacterium]
MEKVETKLPGVFILCPRTHHDTRGVFYEAFNQKEMLRLGIKHNVVQINRSRSSRNVLRGLHFQRQKPQAKVVRVIRGKIMDVVVDVRPNSPSFKKHAVVELSSESNFSIYIPAGFAHGFLVLSKKADVEYTCDEYYSGTKDQCGVRWNDPDIGITWPPSPWRPILSKQDADMPWLRNLSKDSLPNMNALRK